MQLVQSDFFSWVGDHHEILVKLAKGCTASTAPSTVLLKISENFDTTIYRAYSNVCSSKVPVKTLKEFSPWKLRVLRERDVSSCLHTYCPHSAFLGCIFLGAQDTLCNHLGRHYYKDCYIEGSVDSYLWQCPLPI